MDIAVSVVVSTDAAQSILGLIGSVDRQSPTTEECELVVVDRGLTDDQRNALRRVAARRPNVQVVRTADDWREVARGRFVLAVPPTVELFPEALERLYGYATEHDLEAVWGRVAARGVGVAPLALTDRHLLDAAEAALLQADSTAPDQLSTVVLAARERFDTSEDALAVSLDGVRSGVLASYPTARVPAAEAAASPAPGQLTAAQVEWQGTDLVVTVEAAGDDEHAPVVLARHTSTDISFVLPSTSEVLPPAVPPSAELPSAGTDQPASSPESLVGESSAARRSWRVAARLSPLSAAAGSPLAEGVWELDVHLTRAEGPTSPSTVSGAAVGPGLLEGLLVAVRAPRSGPLQIDVGPTRLSLVGQADPADASVVESARGSLLRLRLPEVNVQTSTTVPGFIALGRMILPASIETVGGTAVLVAFVSGITGSSPLSVQFGSARHQPTGLSLEISGTGGMSVITTPPPVPDPPAKPTVPKPAAKKPAAKKPAAKKPAAKKGARKRPATGPVARLRRMVPEPLEPAVRMVRKNPTVRKVYRRLTGLTR